MSQSLTKIKADLAEVMSIIKQHFGDNYAQKNPGLVQFLIDKVQQEEDRALTYKINNISPQD